MTDKTGRSIWDIDPPALCMALTLAACGGAMAYAALRDDHVKHKQDSAQAAAKRTLPDCKGAKKFGLKAP